MTTSKPPTMRELVRAWDAYDEVERILGCSRSREHINAEEAVCERMFRLTGVTLTAWQVAAVLRALDAEGDK